MIDKRYEMHQVMQQKDEELNMFLFLYCMKGWFLEYSYSNFKNWHGQHTHNDQILIKKTHRSSNYIVLFTCFPQRMSFCVVLVLFTCACIEITPLQSYVVLLPRLHTHEHMSVHKYEHMHAHTNTHVHSCASAS